MKYLLVGALCLISIYGFAGGGDVVGNGAGLSENNIVYTFKLLPQLLDSCMEKASCHQNASDLEAYRKIHKVVLLNLNKSPGTALQFASMHAKPDFFVTGVNEPNRIAKTCLSTDCPVYFNIDLLNQSNLSYPALAGLLVHEFGHQAGFTDHIYLDYLGAKIRIEAEAKYVSFIYPFDFNKIEIRQINSDFPLKFSEVHFVWNGVTTRLTEQVFNEVSSIPGFIGFEMFNGHYVFENSKDSYVQFEIMAKVFRRKAGVEPVQLELIKFKLEVNTNGKIYKFARATP